MYAATVEEIACIRSGLIDLETFDELPLPHDELAGVSGDGATVAPGSTAASLPSQPVSTSSAFESPGSSLSSSSSSSSLSSLSPASAHPPTPQKAVAYVSARPTMRAHPEVFVKLRAWTPGFVADPSNPVGTQTSDLYALGISVQRVVNVSADRSIDCHCGIGAAATGVLRHWSCDTCVLF
jgi:hypothetical protein